MGITYLDRVLMGMKKIFLGMRKGMGMGTTAWEWDGMGTKIHTRTPLV